MLQNINNSTKNENKERKKLIQTLKQIFKSNNNNNINIKKKLITFQNGYPCMATIF